MIVDFDAEGGVEDLAKETLKRFGTIHILVSTDIKEIRYRSHTGEY